jgi:GlpG protein
MRQLATLPSADTARILADYLLTLRIDTRVDPQPEGWVVWVCDEDRLPQARKELEEFNRNPHDARYTSVARTADNLRREKSQEEKKFQRRQERVERSMAGPSCPWTVALIAASVVVTFLGDFGQANNAVVQALSIAPYHYIEDKIWFSTSPREIEHGQVWRLVTPIFLHLGPLHLLFNMLMLYQLGGPIEMRRGSVRYLLLVLVLAVLSNLAQYSFGHPVPGTPPLDWPRLPNFGGMSGVIYGLFGYMWMKARYQPELGLYIHPQTVVYLLVWFVLCLTGWLGPVANMAHGGGLLAGIVLGCIPVWWNSLRNKG